MCGFVGAFDLSSGSQPIDEGLKEQLRAQVLEMSKKIRHRGPDWSGVYTGNNAILSHERLSIVDPLSGKQPLVSDDEKIILAANGEIYNHKELRKEFEASISSAQVLTVKLSLHCTKNTATKRKTLAK